MTTLPGRGSDTAEPAEPRARRDSEASPEVAAVPARVGEFVLDSPSESYGAGAMGVVYAARHVTLGYRAAVKLAPITKLTDVSALRNEAEALARIDHPNVLRVLALGREGGWAWMACELVDGSNLLHHLRRRYAPARARQVLDLGDDEPEDLDDAPIPLSREEGLRILRWFRDLAHGLGAVHEADLLHRDVKPANIMVSPGDRIRLIDFGLAMEVAPDGSLPERSAGTIRYMSPEQAAGLPLRIASDVYSLAVTLLEALTGRPAVEADGLHAMRSAIVNKEPDALGALPPWAPDSLRESLAKALRKDPDRRYSSARLFAEDLERILAGRAPLHTDPVSGSRALRPLLRRRTVLLAALVLAVALPLGHLFLHRHRAGRLAGEVHSLLDAHDPLRALALAREHRGAFGGIDAFDRADRRAVEAGNWRILESRVSESTLLVTGIEEIEGYARDLELAAKDAKAHPEALAPRVLDAFRGILDHDATPAMPSPAPGVPEPLAMAEIRCTSLLVEIAQRAAREPPPDSSGSHVATAEARTLPEVFDAYAREHQRLAGRHPGSRGEACLRAARILFLHHLLVDREPLRLAERIPRLQADAWSERAAAAIGSIREELVRHRSGVPGRIHVGLESLIGRLCLLEGRFGEAERALRRIDDSEASGAIRRPARVFRGMAMVLDRNAKDDLGGDLAKQLVDVLGSAMTRWPGLAGFAVRTVDYLDYRHPGGAPGGRPALFLARVLTENLPLDLSGDRDLVEVLAHRARNAFNAGDAGACLFFGRRLARDLEPGSAAADFDPPGALLEDLVGALLFTCSSGGGASLSQVAGAVREARACFDRHGDVLARFPASMFYLASLEERLAELEEDPERIRAARLRALALHRRLVDGFTEADARPPFVPQVTLAELLREARARIEHLESLLGG